MRFWMTSATKGVTEDEVERAKTQARAQLVRQLQSNTGLAVLFSYHEAVTGDWSDIFTYLDDIDQVSAEDVQRVIGETFTKSNRTVAIHQHHDARHGRNGRGHGRNHGRGGRRITCARPV